MAKVLIIGSGGREHALGWKLSQSESVEEVLYAPGNGGSAHDKGRNIPLNGAQKEHFPAIAALIKEEGISLTVVGPEAPLTDGLVDYLEAEGIDQVWGPKQHPAQLESDKFFSFEIMERLSIPQAEGVCCRTEGEAHKAIARFAAQGGVVLKARGLAAGKGVVVCQSEAEAQAALPGLIESYGPDILVCEKLSGPEFSVFALCNGKTLLPIEVAFQDHKARDDGDKGPNTGGMGAYGPTPIAPVEMIQQVCDQVIKPLLHDLDAQGHPFRGFLYAGMMLTEAGPKTLEFNVRFGDPECQAAMMMLDSDLYPLLASPTSLDQHTLRFKPGAACCVVMASNGYPGSYQKGLPIIGLDQASSIDDVVIFHAGTKQSEGNILTNGGRVLGVTGYAENLRDAQALAYKAAHMLHIEGGFHFRSDIAKKAFAS